jgi:hypothetical protein
MVQPGVLGPLAGFFGAMVTLGIPLVAFLYRMDQRSKEALRLLTGEDEVEHDGVIPRLRAVEQRSVENRMALRRHDPIDVPDLENDAEIAVRDDRRKRA